MQLFTSAIVSLGLALTLAACQGKAEPTPDLPVQEPSACGGIAGLGCPDGLTCVDQPNDDCDPNMGGADCIGMCVKSLGPDQTCDPEREPGRTYVATSPDQCAVIRFVCEQGTHYFANNCGCGCETD